MCDVSDPRILNTYYAITDLEPTDWLLMGYKDSRNAISLYGSGTDGPSEFRSKITNEILFGFVRIEDKFILITYVPDSVNGIRRARALVHSRSVAAVCELSHAQITASSLSDLSDNNLRTRLKLNQNQPKTVKKKRSSMISTRRRTSVALTPTPPPISTFPSKRASLLINTAALPTEEPYTVPSSPTASQASFSDTTTVVDCNSSVSSHKELEDTEHLFQTQLLKKKELEESRFRQHQMEQEEKKIKVELYLKQKQLAEEREKAGRLTQAPVMPVITPPPTAKLNLWDGFASLQTRQSPFWKRRYVVIDNTKNILIYKDEVPIKQPITTLNLLDVTRLAPANEDEDTFVPNSFIIDTPSDSFQFLADDKLTGKKILTTLQTLVQ